MIHKRKTFARGHNYVDDKLMRSMLSITSTGNSVDMSRLSGSNDVDASTSVSNNNKVQSILKLTPEMINGSPYSTSRQIKKELRKEISENSLFKATNAIDRAKQVQKQFGNVL